MEKQDQFEKRTELILNELSKEIVALKVNAPLPITAPPPVTNQALHQNYNQTGGATEHLTSKAVSNN